MAMLHEDIMSLIIPFYSCEMLHCVKIVSNEEVMDNQHLMIYLYLLLLMNELCVIAQSIC